MTKKQRDVEKTLRCRAKNPERYARYQAKWRKKNMHKMVAYNKARRHSDPIFAMISRVRRRICKSVGFEGKQDRSICLLGCTPRQFKHHLESLFLPGMSWANRHLWHIDHIKPISKFDLSTLEGQQAAFRYSNCQPLWAADNLRKGATIT